jgi:hypothetical protein
MGVPGGHAHRALRPAEHVLHMPASWFSFGTARRRGLAGGITPPQQPPAILSEALIRPHLVYPLASLDVSGQWPVSHTAASPNEGSILHRYYPTIENQCQVAKITKRFQQIVLQSFCKSN